MTDRNDGMEGAVGIDTDLEREIDRLSLDQALRDFEIANARVVDLTQRLISANQRVAELQAEVDAVRTDCTELRSRHDAMEGSAAYRLAERIWQLRNLLKP